MSTLLSLYLPDAVAGAGLVGYDIISGPGLSHGLFATIGDATTQPGLTQWPVTIDVGALGTLPISLRLNLPGRATVTLSRDRSEQRGAAGICGPATAAIAPS